MTLPLVSIIIVNHNGSQHLKHLLPTLTDQNFPFGDYEIILVDNGSRDNSIRYTASHYPDIRIIPLESNTGFAPANNEGIKAATGKYAALINNDTRADPDWLSAHFRMLQDSDSNIICSSGRILDWSGEHIDFIRGIITFDGHAFQLHQGRKAGQVPEEHQPARLPFPCGGNMMILRENFLELGGFDPDFFAYLEDVDLGWRMNSSGYRIAYQPEALIYHRGSATGLALGLYRRAFLFEKNAYMVAYKNMEGALLNRLHTPILQALMHRLDRTLTLEPSLHADIHTDPYKNRERLSVVKVRSSHVRNHLRAFHWITGHSRLLHSKRMEVQAKRKEPDSAFLKAFPLHIIPTYPGDDLLFSNPMFNSGLPSDIPFTRKTLHEIMAL